MIEKGFKYIDLFCGIGGFHQAMENLGGECVFASDIDADCRKTYERNYGSNLKVISPSLMPKIYPLMMCFVAVSLAKPSQRPASVLVLLTKPREHCSLI